MSSSPTAVGQTESVPSGATACEADPAAAASDGRLDHTDAISKLFMQFQYAYHNQYHKAFPDEQDLIIAKKFWLQNLRAYPVEVILQAGASLIRHHPYLPSIATMIDACDRGGELFGLPDVRTAYVEACLAPAPKSTHPWSHAAVYFAGQASGWYLLANASEQTTFPLFEHHYTRLCRRVLRGEELEIAVPPPLPEKTETPLSKTELKRYLGQLRRQWQL